MKARQFCGFCLALAATGASAQSVLELPPVDPANELAKRAFAEKSLEPGPLQFALPRDVAVTPKTHGDWIAVDGGREWRLRVIADGATDLNFGFTTFALPEGATLELMVEGGKAPMRYGPYTNAAATRGEFWSPPLPGDEALLLLKVPDRAPGRFELELGRVGTGFRDLYKLNGGPGLRKQGACNNDVICPEGNEWRDEIRSVAAYMIGTSDACTGTMVMDATGTLSPFFLTAWHCGVRSNNAASVVTIWNYESPNCGDLSGGSRLDTVSGSTFRAGRADVDSTLLELSSSPPAAYGVYWAGWDRTDVAPTGSVAIHHPGVDEKAISFNLDPLTKVNSCIIGGTVDTHWEVDNWEDGTTEPGSSGSGLFHPDNQTVIGFLSGGGAACGNNLSDCYGRFAVGWSGGNNDAERLAPWLDPTDVGTMIVPGTDPGGFSLEADQGEIQVCAGDMGQFELDVNSFDGFSGAVTLSASGLPAGAAETFSDNPVTAGGASSLTITTNGGLVSGRYAFLAVGNAASTSRSLPLVLEVPADITAAPGLMLPADDAADTPTNVTLQWDDAGAGVQYDVQVATDPQFTNLVANTTVATNQFAVTPALAAGTRYYWRVRARSDCGESGFSASRTFVTADELCVTSPTVIPDDDAQGVDSVLPVDGPGILTALRVSLGVTHTYVGDLIVTLEHGPSGTEVVLLDRPGVPGSANGCSGDDIDVLFDDSAGAAAESQCDNLPAINGTLRPLGSLGDFDGLPLAGGWTLTVSDNAGADQGTLDRWCLLPQVQIADEIFADGFELNP